jgi:hypothetical protein
MATLIAVLIAASLSAHPAKLVLGKDAGAELTLRAPAGAKVTLSTSVGTVSAPTHAGDLWSARFTPPPLKSPSVALVLAQIEQDGGRELSWLAIPLSGSDTMEIETRPGASVRAEVAGTTVGPVIADSSGTARLPMVVAPGVNTATLHITDKLGNSSDKPLDLEPPPFSRVRVAARSAGASTATPAELEIFVVRPDGTPDDDAKVELKADEGEASVRRRIDHGVYLGRFLAPPGKSGSAHLEVKANGQLAAVDLPVTLAHVVIAQPFWRSALVSEQPWSVAVGLIGGGGATFDGASAGTILLEVAVRLEILPLEAVLDLGPSWFSEVSQYGANPTNSERARSQSRLGQIGVRLGRQLTQGVDGHATLLFGLQDQLIDRIPPPPAARISQDGWTPRFALALGASIQLGPGRALAQVQFDSSASGIAGLAGSLSSVQAMAGYLLTVR